MQNRILFKDFLFTKDHFFHTKLSNFRAKFLYSDFLLFIFLSCNIFVTFSGKWNGFRLLFVLLCCLILDLSIKCPSIWAEEDIFWRTFFFRGILLQWIHYLLLLISGKWQRRSSFQLLLWCFVEIWGLTHPYKTGL